MKKVLSQQEYAKQNPNARWQIWVTNGSHSRTAKFWQTLPSNKKPRFDNVNQYRLMPANWVIKKNPWDKKHVAAVVKEIVKLPIYKPQEEKKVELNSFEKLMKIVDVLYMNDVISNGQLKETNEYITQDMSMREVNDVLKKISEVL